ncbi:MAG: class A beta-lactamase [Bacteroidia bacterium]|nr:class A beta-lactamase [Bacteroidia bacterium]
MRNTYINYLLFLAFFLFIPTIYHAQEGNPDRLKGEIQRLEKLSGGRVGVGIIHLESGKEFFYNKDVIFPMASTYKIPVAVKMLQLVEAGELRLDSMVTIGEKDIHPGSGTISRLLNDPGLAISALNLMELMMLISDNSATDLCMKLAEGPDVINEMLRKYGIKDLSVDRPTVALIANYLGIDLMADEEMSMDEMMKKLEDIDEKEQEAAMAKFSEDPRDQSSPYAMAKLLEKLWDGEMLNKENTELLLDIMLRCETGENRLKGVLPPGTALAHKTGTIGGTTNDVGIIYLPEEAGHVVVVVFVKDSEKEIPQREKSIAHIARAAYDYFLFHP